MEEPTPSSDWMLSSDWVVIRDPRAALALRRPNLRDTFHQLMEKEGTVSSVARALGLTLNAAYLNVRALQHVGLVVVSREQRRGGRAIKHYTVVSRQLFIPFAASGVTDLETLYEEDFGEQAHQLVRALLRACREAWGEPPTLGTSHYLDEAGRAISSFGPEPGTTWSRLDADSPATVMMSGALWMTTEEAKAMQRELSQLHERYARRLPGRRAYRLVVGLSPEEGPRSDEAEP